MMIKSSMQCTITNDPILEIIDILDICHILTITWTTLYDEFKPLEQQWIRCHVSVRRMSNIPQSPNEKGLCAYHLQGQMALLTTHNTHHAPAAVYRNHHKYL